MPQSDDIHVTGHCYCGGVRFAVDLPADARPIFTAYCHCDSCRRAHSAPLYHIVCVDKSSFSITSGADLVREFERGGPLRAFCSQCGSKVYNTFGGWRPKGRVPLGFFPNLLEEAAQRALPEIFRPRRMNRPDECVLDTEFLKTLDGLGDG